MSLIQDRDNSLLSGMKEALCWPLKGSMKIYAALLPSRLREHVRATQDRILEGLLAEHSKLPAEVSPS